MSLFDAVRAWSPSCWSGQLFPNVRFVFLGILTIFQDSHSMKMGPTLVLLNRAHTRSKNMRVFPTFFPL